MPGRKYYFWRNLHARRIMWAKYLLSAVCVVFIARLSYLQLVRGDYYMLRTEKNRLQYFYIPAPRGCIYDRNGIEIAGNQPRYSLFFSPEGIDQNEKEKVAERLSNITGRSFDYLMERFRTAEQLPFGVINLLPYLKKQEIFSIEENLHHLSNVSIQIEPRRKYPYGSNGSHFLGYIGEINRRELQERAKFGYKLKDKIGKSGIEKVFDRVLRGRDGYQEVEVSVTGSQRRIVKTHSPDEGNSLLLSIDWRLQQAAGKALGQQTGAVVAMVPNTGEILVWLSQPGFNPEDFTTPLSEEKAREIFDNPDHPLLNRVIQGQYAPGSIFKIVTAMAALESGSADYDTEYECRGSIRIGNKIYRCWEDKKHGLLDLKEAIANSCNVYFYQLGMDTGVQAMHRTALAAGLGRRSQDIFPEESPGLIPDASWKKKQFGIGWYPGDSANMSVGQGFVLVNPMQIVKLVSAVAAGGKMFRPHLVKLVVSPDGKIVKKIRPVLEREMGISKEYIDFVGQAMQAVVDHGTAKYLNLPFPVAAKTGTAENPMGDDHAWFTCFAPVENPEIAVAVLVENGGYGSVAAMPVARAILKEYFRGRYEKKG